MAQLLNKIMHSLSTKKHVTFQSRNNKAKKLNNDLNDKNHTLYANTAQTLIIGNIPKSITQVLSEEINCSIYGVQGRDYQAVFDVLKDTIRASYTDPDLALRNALKTAKKPAFPQNIFG